MRHTRRSRSRLGGYGTFKRVLDHRLRAWSGPLGMAIAPVSDPNMHNSRLGISIGRSVGNAVKRNRIKRLIREAFRTFLNDWPEPYDVVIMVRPHSTLHLSDYAEILRTLKDRIIAKSDIRVRSARLNWPENKDDSSS